MRFLCAAGVGHRALARRADVLGITPQRARIVIVAARPPCLAPLSQDVLGDFEFDRPGLGVDGDDVTLDNQRNRAAVRRFGPDMADAKPARRAREPPVGDQRDFLAQPQAIERRGGREHLAHSGAALGAFVADHHDAALADGAGLDRGEGVFLALEYLRRAGELEPVHSRDLDDRAIGGKRAAQAHDPAGGRKRGFHVVYDFLVGVPGDFCDVLAQRLAGDGDR